MLNLEYCVCSSIGKVRKNNEDNFFACGEFRADLGANEVCLSAQTTDAKALFAVCDGMGGEDSGEIASQAAAAELSEIKGEVSLDSVLSAILRANEKICDEIENNGGTRMGTTLVSLFIDRGTATGFNVGDSRLYHCRAGELKQLSCDHTEAQSLYKIGIITLEEIKHHPSNNKLTQYLGVFPDEMIIEPYRTPDIAINDADVFLLCSDGLTDMLSDEEIKRILTTAAGAKQAASLLVAAALDGGGKDNITVIVVKAGKQTSKSPQRAGRKTKALCASYT